jgi:flagellum-specific ATP synthase
MIERYEDSRDIRSIGGYKQGTDPELDECVELVPKLYNGLIQHPHSPRIEDAFAHLSALLVDGQQLQQNPKS